MNSFRGLSDSFPFSRLPPPSQTLAILLGCAELTIFGIAGLYSPGGFATGFGLPLSSTWPAKGIKSASDPAEDKEKAATHGYISALAARNIANGALILAFGTYFKDRRALGAVILSGIVTTFADAMVVSRYGPDKSAIWGHVVGIVNSTLIGGALLFSDW